MFQKVDDLEPVPAARRQLFTCKECAKTDAPPLTLYPDDISSFKHYLFS